MATLREAAPADSVITATTPIEQKGILEAPSPGSMARRLWRRHRLEFLDKVLKQAQEEVEILMTEDIEERNIEESQRELQLFINKYNQLSAAPLPQSQPTISEEMLMCSEKTFQTREIQTPQQIKQEQSDDPMQYLESEAFEGSIVSDSLLKDV